MNFVVTRGYLGTRGGVVTAGYLGQNGPHVVVVEPDLELTLALWRTLSTSAASCRQTSVTANLPRRISLEGELT